MAGQAQKPFSKLKHIKYDYGQQDRKLIVFIWDLIYWRNLTVRT